jgi:Holliday junction resolvase
MAIIRTRKAIGKQNRQKGAEGEREIAAILTAELGIPVKRILGQARDSGSDISTPPYRWEIKRRKAGNIAYQWMEQAIVSLLPGERPIVAFRSDGKKWMVVMPLEEAVKLIREELIQNDDPVPDQAPSV